MRLCFSSDGEEDLFVVADKLLDVAERQLMEDCEVSKLH